MKLIVNTPYRLRIGPVMFYKRWRHWLKFKPYAGACTIVTDDPDANGNHATIGKWYEFGISGIVVSFTWYN